MLNARGAQPLATISRVIVILREWRMHSVCVPREVIIRSPGVSKYTQSVYGVTYMILHTYCCNPSGLQ